MTTYYVRKSGNDSTGNGLTPATAWLTIDKALDTLSVTGGAQVWVGAGTYREVLTPACSPSSGNAVTVTGDVDGSHTGDPGDVILSAYTSGDTSAPSSSNLITFNAKDFLTFQKIIFICPNALAFGMTTATSTNITFQDCVFLGYFKAVQTMFRYTGVAGGGTAAHLLFERCICISAGNFVEIICDRGASGTNNNNLDIVIRNCFVIASSIASLSGSGVPTGDRPAGVTIRNCFHISVGSGKSFEVTTSSWSVDTTTPGTTNCAIWDSIILSGIGSGALNANVAGQISEDGNVLHCPVGGTNVNAGSLGARTKNDGTIPALIEMGQALIMGRRPRIFGEPAAGSPLLNWGQQSGGPTTDLLNNTRPAGAGPSKAAGPLERGNSWVKETGTVRTGSNAISCTGPGYQDFDIPVDAVSTTVSIYLRRDSTYDATGTSLPQLQVYNGEECGVASASATCVGAANAWEQVSLNFTPTSAGIVTVRVRSWDVNGAGKAFADDLSW